MVGSIQDRVNAIKRRYLKLMSEEQHPTLRPFQSEPSLQTTALESAPLITHAKSQPALTSRHPLLAEKEDLQTPHNYHEYLFAAETLENIVNESALIGTIRSKYRWFASPREADFVSKDMSDRVLKLVYGTMKYLPYIDHIIVKTQFLVFNNQFLDSLGLVKIMIFDLMTHHFNYKTFAGIDYTMPTFDSADDEKYQKYCLDLVKDLEQTLFQFQVKLGAAYARLRIEKKAAGADPFEQMQNMLPESVRAKEDMAIDVTRTLRINSLKCTKKELVQQCQALKFNIELQTLNNISEFRKAQAEDLIYLDDDFSDLLVIPSSIFASVKASPLVKEGLLVFQDKASMYGPAQLKGMIKQGDKVIDARAGCGTKLAQLCEMVGKKGHVYAFEHRPSRLESLHYHLQLYGCKNVTIIEDEFINSDFKNELFSQVSSIVVEPGNSGTTVIDKLGYMLQEEEYPADHLSQKELYTLKRQQLATLKHAFKFPSVGNILYITRSVHSEENEQVVTDALERYGVEWKLQCVLPDIPSDNSKGDLEIEECLTIHPSPSLGNGIFVANFQLKPLVTETIHRQEDPTTLAKRLSEQNIADLEKGVDAVKPKRQKKQGRKKGEMLKIKLPKSLRASVDRLSVPRIFQVEKKQGFLERKHTIYDSLGKPISRPGTTKDSSDVNGSVDLTEAQVENMKVEEGDDLDRQFADLGVMGISIKKFFGPRADALEKLHKQQTSLNQLRWTYPVPNPTVWK